MKLLGALLAVCAAAAVIPYKVEIDKENKTFKAQALTYELSTETDEDGEKSVNICFFPDAKKACCACEDAIDDAQDAIEDAVDAIEDAVEEVVETVEEAAQDALDEE